ncbi:hypothetical protein [Caldovatus aquaticus]|uniref:Uncharacterized protein n=1 Tax=Caldovatus aquaticus TaxID=2865671 RepID=A0ABS7EY73_9PROT|nr:hypothetical protein [Caldovatus aquaticus]MBW8268308.1 hypothetical protein [Caldovatus aquaticus]
MDAHTPTAANDTVPPRRTNPEALAAHLALDLDFIAAQLDELMARLFHPDIQARPLMRSRGYLLPPLKAAIARCRQGLERR